MKSLIRPYNQPIRNFPFIAHTFNKIESKNYLAIFYENIYLKNEDRIISNLTKLIVLSNNSTLDFIEDQVSTFLRPICKKYIPISDMALQFANRLLALHKDIKNRRINNTM